MFFFLFKYSKEGISESGIPLLPKGRSLMPFLGEEKLFSKNYDRYDRN